MGLTDHEVVALSAMVDRLSARNPNGRFVLHEFGSTVAARLIRKRITSAADLGGAVLASVGQFLDDNEVEKNEDETMLWCRPVALGYAAVRRFLSVLASGVKTHQRSRHGSGLVETQLLLMHRFGTGEIFTPDCFGAILGHIYHFPATIEFVEALSMPTTLAQSNYPWQVACPGQWVGKTYQELVISWASGKDPELEAAGAGCVLVLGLYRCVECHFARHVAVTLPPPSTVLKKDDRITVLGPKEFGMMCKKSQDTAAAGITAKEGAASTAVTV